MTAKKTEVTSEKENLFSKAQLLASKRFDGRKDIVNALLSDNELYSIEAVEEMTDKYMKGKVK